MIAWREPRDAVAHFADHPRALMAADRGRHCPRTWRLPGVGRYQMALTDVFVAMTESGGSKLQENFSGPWPVQLELFDAPWSAVFAQDGGTASHRFFAFID